MLKSNQSEGKLYILNLNYTSHASHLGIAPYVMNIQAQEMPHPTREKQSTKMDGHHFINVPSE